MAEKIIVNFDILKWARLNCGKTIEEVARQMGKSTEIIENWENGTEKLTYAQLEKLAYQVYKRPSAIFFFPSPPEEVDLIKEFRTLPEYEQNNLQFDTRFAIRKAKVLQISLSELNDGKNPFSKCIFKEFDFSNNYYELAKNIRHYLEIDINEQKSLINPEAAFKYWRNAIENVGIYIFKRAFKQRDICGFSLIDEEFPIIYVNNKNTFTRQIFTLFHELAHILYKVPGVTKSSNKYIKNLDSVHKDIESCCNSFAAEFLVPDEDFNKIFDGNIADDSISNLSDIYKVSREVILRKILDIGLISYQYYEMKAEEWSSQKRKVTGKGGNYYLTQIAYLGENYLNLAFSNYYKGKCSLDQLAEYFSMKVTSITKLEDYLSYCQ